MLHFGLFTATGEALVQELVREIADAVLGDRLTRKQAMDRLWRALEAATEIDSAARDSEVMEAVADAINPAFDKAGYRPTTASELALPLVLLVPTDRQSFELLTSSLEAVAEAWRLGAKGALPLRMMTGSTPPWGDDWVSALPDCDLYLYVAEAPVTRNARLGVLLISERGEFAFLQDAIENEAAMTALLGRHVLDHDQRVLLTTLAVAVGYANLNIASINEPDLLRVELEGDALNVTYGAEHQRDATVLLA